MRSSSSIWSRRQGGFALSHQAARRRGALRLGLSTAFFAIALGFTRARADTASGSSARTTPAPGARLVPPLRGPGATWAGSEPDGAPRVIAFGSRAIEHLDGSIEISEELLPVARSAHFLALPPRMGGGFLFWTVLSSSLTTLLYRAETWTSGLRPLARLDFELARVVPGFDRLLLSASRTTDFMALDPLTGRALSFTGLPPAPAYGELAFVDAWFAAAVVPFRGVLLSFDAGLSWRPLGLAATLAIDDDALALTSSSAEYRMKADGLLSRVRDRSPAARSADAERDLASALRPPPEARLPSSSLGPRPLESAVLYGYPDGRGNAVVAALGNLARVSLRTGGVVEERLAAYPADSECRGFAFASGVGFVCGQGQEATTLYELTKTGFALREVAKFAGARLVLPGGGGALVRGGCEPATDPAVYCVVPARGEPWPLLPASASARLALLGDGRVAILAGPERKSPGSLTLAARDGRFERKSLTLTGNDPGAQRLFRSGLLLEGSSERKPGELFVWAVGADAFVGARIDSEGKVRLGNVHSDPARALFDGERALVLGPSALGAETTDGGFQWRAFELPPDIDLTPAALAAKGPRQGCSTLGCSFAGFVRVGFDGAGPGELALPLAPEPVRAPAAGGGNWSLRCIPTGEQTPLALSRPLARWGRKAPAPSLVELGLPDLPKDYESVATGDDGSRAEARLIAFGPSKGEWTREGSLQIAFVDRFSIGPRTLASRPGRSLWSDADAAGTALSSAGVTSALDPDGRAGGMLVRSNGASSDLYLFELGRPPLRIANAASQGLSRLAGVVKTRAGFFVGGFDSQTRKFRVYRVAGQELEVLVEAEDIPSERGPNAELVRSADGERLGIWVRGPGWFVHPIEGADAAIEAPFVARPPALAALPERCHDSSPGFVLVGPPPTSPHAEFARGYLANDFEGRFRLSALGLCVDRLAAKSDSDFPFARPTVDSVGPEAVPLILTDRARSRRLAMVCSR